MGQRYTGILIHLIVLKFPTLVKFCLGFRALKIYSRHDECLSLFLP